MGFLDILQKVLSFTYLLNFFCTVAANITLLFLAVYLLGDDKDCVSDSRMDAGVAIVMACVGLAACLYHILSLNLYDHYGICKDGPFLTRRYSLCGSQENDYMHLSASLFTPCDFVKLCCDLLFDMLYYVMAFFAFVIKKASCDSLDFTLSREDARAGDKYLYYCHPCKDGEPGQGVFDKQSTARDIFGMTLFLSGWAYLPAILLRGNGLDETPVFALDNEANSVTYSSDCSSELDTALKVNDALIVGFFFLNIANILSVVYANTGVSMNKAVVFGAFGDGEFGDPVRPLERKGVNFDHGEYGMGSRGMA